MAESSGPRKKKQSMSQLLRFCSMKCHSLLLFHSMKLNSLQECRSFTSILQYEEAQLSARMPQLLLFCSMKCHSWFCSAVWSSSLMSQFASVIRYEEAQVSTRRSELLASKDTASNTCCHREKLVLQNTILLKYSSLHTSCWSLEMLHAASMCADDNEDICRSCTTGVLQL